MTPAMTCKKYLPHESEGRAKEKVKNIVMAVWWNPTNPRAESLQSKKIMKITLQGKDLLR